MSSRNTNPAYFPPNIRLKFVKPGFLHTCTAIVANASLFKHVKRLCDPSAIFLRPTEKLNYNPVNYGYPMKASSGANLFVNKDGKLCCKEITGIIGEV